MRSVFLTVVLLSSLASAEFRVLDEDVAVLGDPTQARLPTMNARFTEWLVTLTEVENAGAIVPEPMWIRYAQAVQQMAERGFAPGRPLADHTTDRPLRSAMLLLHRSRHGQVPAVQAAARALVDASRPDVPGEVEMAWDLMSDTGMLDAAVGQEMALRWIGAGAAPGMLETIQARYAAQPAIHAALARWIFRVPVLEWGHDRQRLAYRMVIPDDQRAALVRSAITQLGLAAQQGKVDQVWLPFMVVMNQSQYANTLTVDAEPILHDVLSTKRGVLQRLALWLACCADANGRERILKQHIPTVFAAIRGDQQTPKQAPGTDDVSRVHGTLLLAFFPTSWMPPEVSAPSRQHAIEWSSGALKQSPSRSSTLEAASYWSLCLRTEKSAVPIAERLATPRPEVFDELRLWHVLGQNSPYGKELAKTMVVHSGRKDLTEKQVADLQTVAQARKPILAVGYAIGRPTWEGVWDCVDMAAPPSQEMLGVICQRFYVGALSEKGRQYVKACILPRFLKNEIPEAIRPMMASVLARVVGTDPEFINWASALAATATTDMCAWNDGVDIILSVQPHHAVIVQARKRLEHNSHPADEFVRWLFEVASGGKPNAFPAHAYRHLLGHPHVDVILARMSTWRTSLVPYAADLRDPSILLGHYATGLDQASATVDADRICRLLGILDAVELQLWGK